MKQPRFTPEQHREIEDARARWVTFLVEKCGQTYPYAPEEEKKEVKPEPEWTRRQWDVVQQLQSEVRGWRQKHAETLLAYDKVIEEQGRHNEPF